MDIEMAITPSLDMLSVQYEGRRNSYIPHGYESDFPGVIIHMNDISSSRASNGFNNFSSMSAITFTKEIDLMHQAV